MTRTTVPTLLVLSACLVDPGAWEARRAELEELTETGTRGCDPAPTWFADEDEDGVGGASLGQSCEPPEGAVEVGGDCDDESPAVPGDEIPADGVDSDCDGSELCHVDADGDDYGLQGTTSGPLDCLGEGLAPVPGDCNDASTAVSPGEVEILCNSVDDDCDPATGDEVEEVPGDGVDEDCDGVELCFVDEDDDGFGTDETRTSIDPTCGLAGRAPVAGDCDDGDEQRSPGVPEICNGVDDDCDLLVDDDDASVDPAGQRDVPVDADGDGFGHATDSELACDGPPFDNRLDCDDTDPLATIEQDWFADTDGDLAGSGAPRASQCSNPGGGLVPELNGLDCAPSDPTIFPLQLEDCVDGTDQNCDDLVDCADPDCAADAACAPPCADLAWMPAALPATVTGSTAGQGNDSSGSCQYGGGSLEVAYWFTPPTSGTVIFDTSGSSFDTVLYVVDSCGGAELQCNDDAGGLWSAVQVAVTAGVPILVVVDGFDPTARGAYRLRVQ